MNLLFLADPNSIHDIKWMTFFSKEFTCYLVARDEHVAHWKEEDYARFYGQHGIRIVGSLGDFSIRRYLRTLAQWRKLSGILTHYRIDVFHVMYADPNALWAAFRNPRDGRKWVLTTRGSDVLKGIPPHFERRDPLNRVVAGLYRKAFGRFDRITCTSRRQQESVAAMAATARLEIIRTGVDVQRVLSETASHRNPALEGRKYVLFPRNMRPVYNHEFSIGAIRLLSQSIKNGYVFVFVDRDSPDRAYVEKIEALMAADDGAQFLFLGRQSQEGIWQLYKEAALVVMNPLSDGAPVSAMEALLCRSPLVVGNLDYDADLFGDTAIRLRSWEPGELATVITSVLSGETATDREAGYARIHDKGNREHEMSKLRTIYLS